MPFLNVDYRFPPMCVGCAGTEDLGVSRLSHSYVRAGYRHYVSCKVPLCAQCDATARHERKIVLIGGLVSLCVGIVSLALANILIDLIGYGFMVILIGSFITCFGFFDRAYALRDLANKYAMLKGIHKDKHTDVWKPKFRFKNASFRAAYEEINNPNVTIGQIASYLKPAEVVNSGPALLFDEPATYESTLVTSSARNCPDCGAEIPITAKFCNKCGHRF